MACFFFLACLFLTLSFLFPCALLFVLLSITVLDFLTCSFSRGWASPSGVGVVGLSVPSNAYLPVSQTIIVGSPICVEQNLFCAIQSNCNLMRLWRVIDIRVVFANKPPVRRLYHFPLRYRWNTQNFVEFVGVGHLSVLVYCRWSRLKNISEAV